jgi:UDP-N-acetylmuramoyl-tripeptide--D-alanyl-D-alanine ligase
VGANHAGEILSLGQLVEPTVAVITNAGAAHLEGFGSLEGVAKAKGELIDCLADDGVAVLNADDRFFDEWRQRAGRRRVVSFGRAATADVRLLSEPATAGGRSRFGIRLPDGAELDVERSLLGRANVANARAAAAAASAAEATAADIRHGLGQAVAVHGRMQPRAGRHGATLIDDSYNANPSAARAALDFLAGCGGTRLFVLGDMLELGDDARALHRTVGDYARGRCDQLIAVGELAAETAGAFGPAGIVCRDIEQAESVVTPLLAEDVTVLIKASRSIGLDRLVARLAEPAGGTSC